jgi:Fe-S cluster assembly ATP-binding protein
MLKIIDLHARVEGENKEILKGLNLEVNPGEVHAIMGPNCSGKSTLSKVVAGHPNYEVTSGQILFEGEDLLEMDPEERARMGLFLAFQYPVEIPGVNNLTFLRMAYNALAEANGQEEMDPLEFEDFVSTKLKNIKMDASFMERSVNAGFSGGEKKRNEILQMAVLQPKLGLLDETDSGLDIDALQVVSEGINALRTSDNAFILITHYQRMLNYVTPDIVHVMIDGRIVKTGDKDLALKLEDQGYDWLTTPQLNGILA